MPTLLQKSKTKKEKGDVILSQCLGIASVLCFSSMLSQTIHKSAFSLTSCLHRAWEPSGSESLWSSQLFLSMRLAHDLLDSSVYLRSFQSLCSSILFSQACVSHSFQLSVACPDCCLLPQDAVASACAFKRFEQAASAQGSLLVRQNKGKTPCQSLREPAEWRRPGTTILWE